MPFVSDTPSSSDEILEPDEPVVLRELHGVHALKYRCKLFGRKMIAQFVSYDRWLGEHRLDGKDGEA